MFENIPANERRFYAAVVALWALAVAGLACVIGWPK